MRQVSNGGVLQVDHGATAIFSLPVNFEGNSVAAGYSGGAIHVDGTVGQCTISCFTVYRYIPFYALNLGRGIEEISKVMYCRVRLLYSRVS